MTAPRPTLVPLNNHSASWLSLCVPAVLSTEGWQIGKTDELTILPVATKNNGLACSFYWSDADGKEVEEKSATHLAVLVSGSDVCAGDCLREQEMLAKEIVVSRDGTLADLAMFNH